MSESRWHGSETLYQVYPRSLYDTTGSGEGDLRGIEVKIPYLKDLGIDAVWISPFFASPLKDGGYDIKDYREVDPRYGCVEDLKALIEAAHKNDIKIMVDFVGNHTSNEHTWFLEEISRPPSEEDKYIWRSESELNNWRSVFSEGYYDAQGNWIWGEAKSAWQKLNVPEDHPRHGLFYLHTFLPEQPDLDWSKPHVRKEMYDILEFYFGELGIDGVRCDAINHTGVNVLLPDEPKNPKYIAGQMNPYDENLRVNSANFPVIYDYLREMGKICREHGALMITEAYDDNPLPLAKKYYQSAGPDVVSHFNFGNLQIPFEPGKYQKHLTEYHDILKPEYIPNHVLGNHDKPRLVSRIERQLANGQEITPEIAQNAERLARGYFVAHAALGGINIIYQGEELGLRDVDIAVEDEVDMFGRDVARTPMPWNSLRNGGFTTGRPWLPLNWDYRANNAQVQAGRLGSHLQLYRQVNKMRKSSEVIQKGEYQGFDPGSEQVLGFTKTLGSKVLAVYLNFSKESQVVRLPKGHMVGSVALSSLQQRHDERVRPRDLLKPFEGRWVSINQAI